MILLVPLARSHDTSTLVAPVGIRRRLDLTIHLYRTIYLVLVAALTPLPKGGGDSHLPHSTVPLGFHRTSTWKLACHSTAAAAAAAAARCRTMASSNTVIISWGCILINTTCGERLHTAYLSVYSMGSPTAYLPVLQVCSSSEQVTV